jgi:hypothetical protein
MAMAARRIMTVAALAIGLGAIGLGAAGSGTAFAGEGAGTSQPKKAIDEGRRVCRNLVPSGTRLTSRVCKTQAEWERAMDKTQEGVLRQQMHEQSGVEQGRPPL